MAWKKKTGTAVGPPISEATDVHDVDAVNSRQAESTRPRLISLSTFRSCLQTTGRYIGVHRKPIFAVCWALLPVPALACFDTSEARCAYVMFVMMGYWISECIPIPITSMIPIALLPPLGILSTAQVCSCYVNDTTLVFFGGLILAIATEHCGLHLRVALHVMRTFGCSHARLLAGICTVTTFVSMWIANAAATAMAVPIVFAILYELEGQGFGKVFDSAEVDPEDPEADAFLRPTNVTKAYLLAAAYASTFGGTGTIVGSPTNLAFKGIYESTFPDADPINFASWIIACFPQMLLNSFLLWLYLRIAYFGYLRPRSREAEGATIGYEGERVASRVIRRNLENLGPVSFHEITVAVLFVGCILLWIFRAPGFIVGWSKILTETTLMDSMPVMLVCILMFILPKEPNFVNFCSKDRSKRPASSSEGLITWEAVNGKMPWGLMLLLGGGFAVSRATRESGLARTIGQALLPLKDLPAVATLALVLLFVNTLTEFTSNVGTANIVLPVVAQMCVTMKIHPLYMMVPVTLTCSYAFRLPVSSPPNAIVAIAGRMSTGTLMIGGCFPSFYTLLTQMILFPTWGVFIFDVEKFPEWAERPRLPS